jgi:hypothetical protein
VKNGGKNGLQLTTIFIPKMDTLSDKLLRRGAPPKKNLVGDLGGAPRLSNLSDRVSILGVGISKDRCLDRSAKLWIFAEPVQTYQSQQLPSRLGRRT